MLQLARLREIRVDRGPRKLAIVSSMQKPAPLTLIFGPKFGAYHNYGPNDVRYVIDRSLAGAIRPLKKLPKVEIGRSSQCQIQIGREGGVDANMRPLLNAFSRKHATLLWMDMGSDYRWVVMTGGIFVSPDGTREDSNPLDGVFLNGRRIPPQNPEPLFENGLDFAKLSLGLHGRIIIQNTIFDENTTSYPEDTWRGEGWPKKEQLTRVNEDTSPGVQRLKAEDAIAAIPDTPPNLFTLLQDVFKFISSPKTFPGAVYRLAIVAIGAIVLVKWLD